MSVWYESGGTRKRRGVSATLGTELNWVAGLGWLYFKKEHWKKVSEKVLEKRSQRTSTCDIIPTIPHTN